LSQSTGAPVKAAADALAARLEDLQEKLKNEKARLAALKQEIPRGRPYMRRPC
jgi:hypothetical protein